VLVSTASYAIMPIFAKVAYAGGVRPSGLLAYRFLIAVGLFSVLPRKRVALSPRQRLSLWGLGALFLINAFGYFMALETAPASMVALVVDTYPVIVALLCALLGFERLTVRGLVAALIAVAGCALTVGGGEQVRFSAGVLFAFLAAFFYGSYIALSSRIGAGVPAEATARHVAQASAVAFLAWAIVDGGIRLPAAPLVWASIAVIAVVSTVIASRTLLAGLTRIGPGRAAVLSVLEVPATLLLAALFLGEALGPWQWTGAALILAAVILQNIGPLRPSPRLAGEAPAG
jgi:drug/metabolite transporter (DMT)-like permease